MTATPTIVVPRELRSSVCPNCGYSLEGLGIDDRCPECGRIRDYTEIVLYGFPGVTNPETGRATTWQWIFLLVRLGILGLICWVVGWYLVVFVALSVGWSLLAYLDRGHPGVCQVRLLPHGVIQFSHGGLMTVLRRLRVRFLWIVLLLAAVAATAWLFTRGGMPGMGVPIAILWVIVTPFAFTAGWDALHYHRSVRQLSENARVDSNMALYRVTKWSSIHRLVLTPTGPNRHRLQLKKRQALFSLENSSDAVDADVALSSDAARVMRELLVSRWEGAEKTKSYSSGLIDAIENLKSEI